LDDAEIHRGVEAQAALVRAERGVVLHAETAVDAHAAGVVDPRDAEDDLPLGLAQTLEHGRDDIPGALAQARTQGVEDLADGLVELGLAGVAAKHLLVGVLELLFHGPLLHLDVQGPAGAPGVVLSRSRRAGWPWRPPAAR